MPESEIIITPDKEQLGMSWRNLFSEKRDFIRMQIKAPAILVVGERQYQLTCLDLSANGARLTAPGNSGLRIGDEGFIEITSGGGHTAPLQANVKICRLSSNTEGEEVAVELMDIH